MRQNSIIIILTIMVSMNLMLHANIDDKIDAIEHASVKDRFELMNKFKRELIKMKEADRMEAIKKLSEKSNHTNAKKALEEIRNNTKHQEMMKYLETHHIDEDNIVNQTTDQEQSGADND